MKRSLDGGVQEHEGVTIVMPTQKQISQWLTVINPVLAIGAHAALTAVLTVYAVKHGWYYKALNIANWVTFGIHIAFWVRWFQRLEPQTIIHDEEPEPEPEYEEPVAVPVNVGGRPVGSYTTAVFDVKPFQLSTNVELTPAFITKMCYITPGTQFVRRHLFDGKCANPSELLHLYRQGLLDAAIIDARSQYTREGVNFMRRRCGLPDV